MNDEPGPVTPAELTSWIFVGVACIVYVIAFVTLQQLPFGADESTPLGWMTFAGAVVGIAAVPAILLTGIRQLAPRLRSVPRSERQSSDS